MKRYYSRLIEKHSWLLLLFLIVPGLLFNDDDYWIATYSHLITIALILMYLVFNPIVIKTMMHYRGVQLFIPFLVYSLLSIFWSTNGYATNVPVRCIGIFTLLTLCYLVTRDQHIKLPSIERILLAGGTLCLILALYKPGSGWSPRNFANGNAAFMHHVYISWLAAMLLLLLLHRRVRLTVPECLLFCFFIACIILSAGRGGLIVFVVGYLCMIFRQENRYREKQVILCLIIPAILIAALSPVGLLKMVNKGASSRSEIFQIHFRKATDSTSHILIGRGLNTNTDLKIKQRMIPHFHSLYLTMMYKGGVIGLALYIIMVGYIIFRGLRIPDAQPWIYIATGMSVALAVDASDFFVWPSALMTCFIIPLFLALFSTPSGDAKNENSISATTG